MTHPILTGWQQTIPRTMTQHDVIQLFQFIILYYGPKTQWTQNNRQVTQFSNFYYNYLYITDLLQLLHSQTCKEKDNRLENTRRH